jgi:uncharacterized protein (TIGR02284 family)
MTPILETISILKGLVVACNGIEQACEESFQAANDGNVKAAWNEIAQKQRMMASELEQAVARLGGDTRHSGLVGNHRFLWTAQTVEDSVAGRCGLLVDAQREVYRRALQANLPLNVQMLVQRQYIEISAVQQRVRQLEQKAGKAKIKLSRAVPRVEAWFDF